MTFPGRRRQSGSWSPIESVLGFLGYLADEGLAPAALLKALDYVKVPRPLPQVLAHGEIRRLLDSIDTTCAEGCRNRAMLELLYSSGPRAAELLGMDVGDSDLRQAVALVHGKGRKDRLVPVGATARRWLQSYLRGIRPMLVGPTPDPALFLTRQGRRVPYFTLRRIVLATAARRGLQGRVTAHVFRRSCASELVRGNANLYHVSRLLGHESLDTLKYYTRLNISDLQRTHRCTHPRERDERLRGTAPAQTADADGGETD